MNGKLHGFTIVELVVVIVVIGILVAITTVTFNGVQRQAKNTAIIHNAEEWMKLLGIMYARHGVIKVDIEHPQRSICLGTKDQYPDTADLDLGQCFWQAYTSDQLEDKISSIGKINMNVDTVNGFRGLQYGYDSENGIDDNKKYSLIWFSLHGEGQDCGAVAGGKVSNYEEAGDGQTACFIDVRQQMGINPIVIMADGEAWGEV